MQSHCITDHQFMQHVETIMFCDLDSVITYMDNACKRSDSTCLKYFIKVKT